MSLARSRRRRNRRWASSNRPASASWRTSQKLQARKAPSGTRQPIGRAVPAQQPVLLQLLEDPLSRGDDPIVTGIEESEDGRHEQRGVGLIAAQRAGHPALLVHALLQDPIADGVAPRAPVVQVGGKVAGSGQTDPPIHCHPRHELGVHELPRLGADLPDPVVRPLPDGDDVVHHASEHDPEVVVYAALPTAVLPGDVEDVP
jgi:hypothetical protein